MVRCARCIVASARAISIWSWTQSRVIACFSVPPGAWRAGIPGRARRCRYRRNRFLTIRCVSRSRRSHMKRVWSSLRLARMSIHPRKRRGRGARRRLRQQHGLWRLNRPWIIATVIFACRSSRGTRRSAWKRAASRGHAIRNAGPRNCWVTGRNFWFPVSRQIPWQALRLPRQRMLFPGATARRAIPGIKDITGLNGRSAMISSVLGRRKADSMRRFIFPMVSAIH